MPSYVKGVGKPYLNCAVQAELLYIFYLIPNTFPVTVIEMFFERATTGKNEASIVPDIPDATEQRHMLRKYSAMHTGVIMSGQE